MKLTEGEHITKYMGDTFGMNLCGVDYARFKLKMSSHSPVAIYHAINNQRRLPFIMNECHTLCLIVVCLSVESTLENHSFLPYFLD